MSIATQGPTTLSVEIAGREITFETGKLAKQADGAVVVREGDTMVLAIAPRTASARARRARDHSSPAGRRASSAGGEGAS